MAEVSGVLDASAVLAVALGELPSDKAEALLIGSCISAVNFSEAIAKLLDKGYEPDLVTENFVAMKLDIRAFDQGQSERAGLLRQDTRKLGLSLGDRACLALADELDCPAVTANKAWADLDIGIRIELIR